MYSEPTPSGPPDPSCSSFLKGNGGGMSAQSEIASPLLERVGGLINIVMRTQVEWADTIKYKAYKWTGAVRPTDVALATAANWSIIKSASQQVDIRSSAGVILETL